MGYLVWGFVLVVVLVGGCGSPGPIIRMNGDDVEVVPTRTRMLATATPVRGDTPETARVFSQPPPREIRSPEFAADGIVFRLENFRLSRSGDGGQTWGTIEVWGDQLVMQVAFAPVPGPDRLIFATVTSYDFPSSRADRPSPMTAHIRSIGVVVSRDGGVSWQPTARQPEIDGVPFRHIRDLVVSPTYAQDQTLVAFAWGPSVPALSDGGGLVRPSALFLSGDGGSSWSPIWRPTGDLHASPLLSSRYASRVFGRAALSAAFAWDRTLLLSMGICDVRISEDGGRGWRPLGSTCAGYPTGRASDSDAPRALRVRVSSVSEFVDSDGRVQSPPLVPTPSPSPRG